MNNVNEELESDADDELDRAWEVTSSPTKDHLLSLLECPVCFHIPLPPIRTCSLGHIICADCCPKLSGCPLCLKPIGTGRSFFAESFLDACVMKCKYAQDGCTLELQGEKLKKHLLQCNFRPIKCTRCGLKVSYPNFEKHLLEHFGRWDLDDGGIRRILSTKLQTARFKIENLEAFSREVLYKALLGVIVISYVVDVFLSYS